MSGRELDESSSIFQYLKERKFFIMKKVYFLIVFALLLGLLFTGCVDIAKITVNMDEELYKSPCYGPETATGMGTRIKPKGTWFMYNEYPGVDNCGTNSGGVDYCAYYIQAGNPKNGPTLIGSYWIEDNSDGTFTAYYDIDTSWIVIDKHLAISDMMNFTAAPGRDDNANWGEPFSAVPPFFVFAHFAMDCAGQLQ
jgi:hypothetical protein